MDSAEYCIPDGWIEDGATSPESLYLIIAMFFAELDKAFPAKEREELDQ